MRMYARALALTRALSLSRSRAHSLSLAGSLSLFRSHPEHCHLKVHTETSVLGTPNGKVLEFEGVRGLGLTAGVRGGGV
jgi:hypothetical protein